MTFRTILVVGLLAAFGSLAHAQSLAPGKAAGFGVAAGKAAPNKNDKLPVPAKGDADYLAGGLPAGGAAGVNVASSVETGMGPHGDLAGTIASFLFVAVGTTSSTQATSSPGR
jgi:hypothetical protein